MQIRILTQYLENHKRLVVPQLGSFIVKEPGRSILFSELLKRDDGVLRGLLCAQGVSELEAAGEIDRFVFEIRHAVERGEQYTLAGFGVMKPGPNDTIAFVYDPKPEKPASSSETSADAAGNAPRRAALQHDKVAEAVKSAFAQPHVSSSVKMNPDPSVRGLRYGKPHKNTDAYRYVDHAPRRRVDRFVWIGVVAAVLAMAAIAFGFWREARERQAETEYIEYPQEAVPQAAENF